MSEPVLVAGQGGQYSIGPPGGPALVYGNAANNTFVQDTQTDTGSLNVQDQAVVGMDGLQFGVDTQPGMVITQTGWCRIIGSGAAALDAYSLLAGKWNDPAIRLLPGAIQVFRAMYPFSSVTRRCYGRGRKIVPSYGQVNQGVVPWVAQFQAADNTWYSDTLNQVSITQAPSFPYGGITPPMTPPLDIAPQGITNSNAVSNTGSLPTWPVFTFIGPTSGHITIPTATFAGLPVMIGYNGVLHTGDTLVIDTRPWARTALLNGASVGNALIGSPMEDMKLQPGTTVVQIGGQDATGTAMLTIAWRNATDAIGGTQ